jgi:hypothetical protein
MFGRADAAEQGVMLAEIAEHPKAPHVAVIAGQGGDDTPTTVAAAIVDQNQLEFAAFRGKNVRDSPKQNGQRFPAIENRHDDRNWIRITHVSHCNPPLGGYLPNARHDWTQAVYP